MGGNKFNIEYDFLKKFKYTISIRVYKTYNSYKIWDCQTNVIDGLNIGDEIFADGIVPEDMDGAIKYTIHSIKENY
jgi:hypothetical protein